MSHLALHSAISLAFASFGCLDGALACVAPDVALLPNELRYRMSRATSFEQWADTLGEEDIRLYRFTHSLLLAPVALLVAACCGALSTWAVVGYIVHLVMDLRTHTDLFSQRPLYPW